MPEIKPLTIEQSKLLFNILIKQTSLTGNEINELIINLKNARLVRGYD